MRKFLFSYFWCALFIAISIGVSNAQENNQFKWIHPTPQGNTLHWVKMWDANNWYVIGDGTTFMKTTNGGNTWDIKSNIYFSQSSGITFATDLNCAFFIDMNTGWAGGEEGKIIKTTNGGLSWDTSGFSGAGDPGTVWYSLYFINANTGFAGGSNSGRMGVTTDGGTTWTRMGTVPGGTYNSIYAIDANNVITAVENGSVRKTTNGGIDWTSTTPTSIPLKKINFTNSTTGYVCGGGGTVRMTTNFGSSWIDMSAGLPNTRFWDIDFVTIGDSQYVYISGDKDYIYRSRIGTTNWDTISFQGSSQTIPLECHSTDFSVSGDTLITVGEYGLIDVRYSPTNRVALTNILKTSDLNDIWAESNTGRVITVGDEREGEEQIIYSTNGGVNWLAGDYHSINSQSVTSIYMINSMTGYVTGSNGVVAKTTNGGANWNLTGQAGTLQFKNDIFFINENTGWIFGQGNYKTTNSGLNWETYNWGGNSVALCGYFINENTGWTVGGDGKIFKTTDGGATTFPQNAHLGTYSINVIQMINENTGWLCGNGGNIRKTTNGGTNWDSINVPLSSSKSMHFIDQWNGMVVTEFGIVFRTRDGGNTWESNEGVSIVNFNSLYMTSTDRAFICGDGANIFRYVETVTGTELTYTNEVPPDYHLEQNYPNPFNPTTTIKFALPRQGTVSLKIYDIAGREVAPLFDNAKLNRGTFEQRFDGSGLASGVYFYSLVVDGQMIFTKKMVLVK